MYPVLSNATRHDRNHLEIFIDDKECMHVFDRGYLEYERFDRMRDIFLVTRLRKNAVIRYLEAFELPTDSSVLSHEMVVIRTTKNRFENVFRLIKVLDSKGNELHLLTKCFNLSVDKME